MVQRPGSGHSLATIWVPVAVLWFRTVWDITPLHLPRRRR